jgi:hypothetical protein
MNEEFQIMLRYVGETRGSIQRVVISIDTVTCVKYSESPVQRKG